MATQIYQPENPVPPTKNGSGHSVSGQGSNGRHQVLGMDAGRLASGLGWFSIGLGVAELLAPAAIARLTGSKDRPSLIRGYGLREIASGIGILGFPQQPAAMWSRVAGDAVDLVTLGASLASPDTDRSKTMSAMAAVAGVAVVDVLCARELTRRDTQESTVHATASVIVNSSLEECYRFWRHLENIPQFMPLIESVRMTGNGRSHWIAKLPKNKSIEWDAEIITDKPADHLQWRSLPGSDFTHAGSVQFDPAPGDRGTVLRVSVDYSESLYPVAMLAKLVGKEPEQLLYKDLRRFKQLIETGEVITTKGQSAGRVNGATWLDSIAR